MSKMESGILYKCMTAEWRDREGKRCNTIIHEWTQTAYGNIENALQFYTKAAAGYNG